MLCVQQCFRDALATQQHKFAVEDAKEDDLLEKAKTLAKEAKLAKQEYKDQCDYTADLAFKEYALECAVILAVSLAVWMCAVL